VFGLGAAMENLWLTTAELGMPVFDHAGVEQRHFCVPADWFDGAHSFGDRNDLYVQHALALSIEAARRALVDSGLTAGSRSRATTGRRRTSCRRACSPTVPLLSSSRAIPAGAQPSGPTMIADSCVLWPDTEDVMGFEFTDRGLEVVLSRSVPQLVRSRFAASVETVCERAGIAVADIDDYLLHPGGAKVLDAYLDVLPVDEAQLHWSREVLRTHGNMSAPTALFVLRSAMDTAACRTGHGPVAGDLALVSAMGPGFAAEPPLATGPYRHLAHPNYVAVVAELAALPLILGAWRTSVWATVGNAAVLRSRIAVERVALTASNG